VSTIKLASVLSCSPTKPQHCIDCQRSPAPCIVCSRKYRYRATRVRPYDPLAEADGGGTFAGQFRCRNAERLRMIEWRAFCIAYLMSGLLVQSVLSLGLVGACQKSKMKFTKLIFAAAVVPSYASSKRAPAPRPIKLAMIRNIMSTHLMYGYAVRKAHLNCPFLPIAISSNR
jgi:hypothetical protein